MAALLTDVPLVLPETLRWLQTDSDGGHSLEDELVTASVTTACSLRSELFGLSPLHIKAESQPKRYLHHAACSEYLGERAR